ncbi:hypothetical protein [Arcicella rigui]|uniref:Long-chain fatty acid transport protein n=1 Tax=Arcicella rigui TaxID=797020 RepID=A0ABU5Q419_9BACT|nr:hypothetical protein [Arcicella rigui]MEA5137541.1 hypothetical protein [Arcicella rigui]
MSNKINSISNFKPTSKSSLFFKHFWVLAFCCFSAFQSYSQETNSPYSFLGVGEVYNGGTAVNSMSGGLGVASSNGLYINTLNPAMLVRNRYTVFEMGVNTEFKSMQNTAQRSGTYSGTIGPIFLALPASPKWTLALGLTPYSTVDYKTVASRKSNILGTDSITYTYSGSGGLNKAVVSNGFKLGKNMAIGLESSLIFGVINRNVVTQNFNDAQRYQVTLANRTNYSGVHFKLGYAWRPKISKDYFLNIGATADFAQNVKTKSFKSFDIYDSSGITLINADTLEQTNGNVKLPANYKVGISLEKPGKLLVSLDYSTTKWSGFSNVSGSSDNLKDAYTVAVGAEYIPQFDAISGYFNHVMYRVGANYTQSPYSLNGGEPAKDMSFSVGVSLPLRTISYINIGFVRGKRGVLATNGLEEVYNKVVVGFSLGDFYWFRKPKID